jgi:hypothetical protein
MVLNVAGILNLGSNLFFCLKFKQFIRWRMAADAYMTHQLNSTGTAGVGRILSTDNRGRIKKM